jgi:GAF domain-containing protein
MGRKPARAKARTRPPANARLVEALEQQAATAEILRLISASPANAQPVFDAIAVNALKLCGASGVTVWRYDRELLHLAAHHNVSPDAIELLKRRPPAAPDRSRPVDRAFVDRVVIHVPDVRATTEFPDMVPRQFGARSYVAIPLLHRGEAVGAIGITRKTLGPFTDRQLALLQTFAAQAVIAIANARLFREQEASNRELREALDQQTATAEILRLIGTSPTDAQPVFEGIARSGVTVLGALGCAVFLVEHDLVRLAATHNIPRERVERLRTEFPAPLSAHPDFVTTVRAGIYHLADIERNPEATPELVERARLGGYRTRLMVPMTRADTVLGVIAVTRVAPEAFSERQVALLKTFADQAVIAIENVRLFNETKEALDRQTATAEILRVIASSPTELQPVLDAVARDAARVCDAYDAVIFLRESDRVRYAAHYGPINITLQRTTLSRGSVTEAAILDRQPVHIHDVLATEPPAFPLSAQAAREGGFRTVLSVPLLRENEAIGAIAIRRREVQPFTTPQIELLKTFADQAVIAIENVRLFRELETRNRDLTEALEQQTATGEILRAISNSPTDVQPVFDAIVRSACVLCDADFSGVHPIDGDVISLGAHHNATPYDYAHWRSIFPMRLGAHTASGRAVAARAPVQVEDVRADPEYAASIQALEGHRTILAVPMLKEGVALGTIVVWRREVRPFTPQQVQLLETFADQAVIAIENVRLFKELGARNRDLTATSEILRVISSSPTDVQPVFDAIVASAATLCDAVFSVLSSFDGHQMDIVAAHNWSPAAWTAARRTLPGPPSRALVTGRAILERTVVHVPDIALDPDFDSPDLRRRIGFRSALAVPMLSEGMPVGAIGVGRAEPGPFSDNQIALLKTFADQAIIAVENVRLFHELQTSNGELTTALDRQTATSDILAVIGRSQTAVRPVFDAILTSAVRLLGAHHGALTRVVGDQIELAASTLPEGVEQAALTAAALEGSSHAQAIRERVPVNIADMQTDPQVSEGRRALARAHEYRSLVTVPLLRGKEALGALGVARPEPGGFADDEIALLRTFADQAVIAIENVRLFTELQEKNRALTTAHAQVTESLERQTATAEILKVISSSPTDLQPVFDTIVQHAVRLCDGLFGALYRFDGELMHHVAQYNYGRDALAEVRRLFPARPSRALAGGRAILERAVVNLPNTELDPEYQQAIAQAAGARSILAVPMLREDTVTGAIAVGRAQPGPFLDNHVELLKTFADQAVIAIENVRLFTDLRDRTAQLGRSVDELTALGQVSQALSSTLEIETVLTTIVQRAIELSGADGGSVYEYDDTAEEFRLRATRNFEEELVEAARTMPLRRGEGALGLVAEQRRPVQIADISDPAVYQSPIRETVLRTGYRAVLALPMLRDDRLVGALAIGRKSVGEFAPGVIDLLTTFANQATLAMQNARLFREIEAKSRQLEVASRHKSDFLANVSHELRTPMNAILGFNEMILAGIYGDVPPDLQVPLNDIQASGQHLLRLINNVLDLSKIEAGRMELALADYSVQDTVESVRASLGSLAAQKGLDFATTVGADIPLARGDAGRITQCLLNLAGNALKFTREGRVEIGVERRGDDLRYWVRDTGIGIAPDRLEAVFGEFRQGDATVAAEFGGTGLGLSITRRFVEMHGGRIWVESELGHGSTFAFTVPLRVEKARTA